MHELVILAVRPFLKMFAPSCSQRIRKVSGIVRCCTCKYFEFYWKLSDWIKAYKLLEYSMYIVYHLCIHQKIPELWS